MPRKILQSLNVKEAFNTCLIMGSRKPCGLTTYKSKPNHLSRRLELQDEKLKRKKFLLIIAVMLNSFLKACFLHSEKTFNN